MAEDPQKKHNFNDDGQEKSKFEKFKDLFKGDKKELKDLGKDIVFFLIKVGSFIIVATQLVFIALFFSEHSRKSENEGVCYGAMEFGRAVTFFMKTSDVKWTSFGSQTTSTSTSSDYESQKFSMPNQIPEWVYSGLVSNGEMIELYVTGRWFPWGRISTGRKIYYKLKKNGDLEKFEDDELCDMSDDYKPGAEGSSGTYDPITGKWKYENQDDERISIVNRYKLLDKGEAKIPITKQNSYIYGYHIDGNYGTLKSSDGKTSDEIYNDIINGNTGNSFTPCAMDRGFGVYIKLGPDAKVAYHIANKMVDKVRELTPSEINNLSKSILPGTQVPKYTYEYDEYGYRKSIQFPFTLPMTDYAPSKVGFTNDYQSVYTTALLGEVTTASSNLSFYGNCQAELTNDPSQLALKPPVELCEFGYPKEGQQIWFSYLTNSYEMAEGEWEFKFKRGARYDDLRDNGVLNWIWNVAVNKTFGINMFSSEISEDSIIKQARNAIVTSVGFQALAYMIIIWFLILYGWQMISGTLAIGVHEVIKRFIHIGFAIWAMNPENYVLIDEFIVPIFLKGVNLFSGSIVNGIAKVNGFSGSVINVNNPYISLDSIISDLFGEAMIAKLLAMWRQGGLFAFLPAFILGGIVGLAFFIIRSTCVIISTVILTGTYITILPFVALAIIHSEKTKKHFDSLMNQLINKAVTNSVIMIVLTIMIGFIMTYVKKVLDYETCYTHVGGVGAIKWYSWDAAKSLSKSGTMDNFILMMFVLYIGYNSLDFVYQFTASIFGGDSKPQSSTFDTLFDGTVGAGSSVLGSLAKPLGLNLSISSKDFGSPMGLISRAFTGTWSATSQLTDFAKSKFSLPSSAPKSSLQPSSGRGIGGKKPNLSSNLSQQPKGSKDDFGVSNRGGSAGVDLKSNKSLDAAVPLTGRETVNDIFGSKKDQNPGSATSWQNKQPEKGTADAEGFKYPSRNENKSSFNQSNQSRGGGVDAEGFKYNSKDSKSSFGQNNEPLNQEIKNREIENQRIENQQIRNREIENQRIKNQNDFDFKIKSNKFEESKLEKQKQQDEQSRQDLLRLHNENQQRMENERLSQQRQQKPQQDNMIQKKNEDTKEMLEQRYLEACNRGDQGNIDKFGNMIDRHKEGQLSDKDLQKLIDDKNKEKPSDKEVEEFQKRQKGEVVTQVIGEGPEKGIGQSQGEQGKVDVDVIGKGKEVDDKRGELELNKYQSELKKLQQEEQDLLRNKAKQDFMFSDDKSKENYVKGLHELYEQSHKIEIEYKKAPNYEEKGKLYDKISGIVKDFNEKHKISGTDYEILAKNPQQISSDISTMEMVTRFESGRFERKMGKIDQSTMKIESQINKLKK